MTSKITVSKYFFYSNQILQALLLLLVTQGNLLRFINDNELYITSNKKYILISATELVGPKYRVISSAVSSSMFAVGQVTLGLIAWLINPWRYLIIALHVPCFLILSYYWFLPESVRWLLSKNKYEEAVKILENVARVNKTQISDKSKEVLLLSFKTSVVDAGVSNFNLFNF